MLIVNLVFLAFTGCSERQKQSAVTVQWDSAKATGMVIPRDLLNGFEEDSMRSWLQVKLADADQPILGGFVLKQDEIGFKPLIPFTRGLTYHVMWRNKLVVPVEIPHDKNRLNPQVTAIYPSSASLPENLLKLYIQFSKPMQEGQAMQNIAVVKNGADTISSIFLDLEPELWNRERTILTVWLDPGRIKRHLQPNQALGAPLEAGNRYQVIIKPGWRDAEGARLPSAYKKDFIVTKRDDASPDPATWIINSPKAGTRDLLKIELGEPLDYQLLKYAVHITDNKGDELKGVIELAAAESVLHFVPASSWVAGGYTVEVEPRLEDLAGNNLQRLFDRDLLKDSTARKTDHKRKFRVK